MLTVEDIEERLKLQQNEQYSFKPMLVASRIPGHPPIITFYNEFYERQECDGDNDRNRLPSLTAKDRDYPIVEPLPTLTAQPFTRRLQLAGTTLEQPETLELYAQQLVVYFHGQQQPSVSSAFQRAGFQIAPRGADYKFNICWGHPMGLDFYKTLAPGYLCGQFPGSNAIGRKDTMSLLLNQARLKYGAAYDFYPYTFTIPDDILAFRECAHEGYFYIYKPAMNSEGRGIELFRLGEEQFLIKEDTLAVIYEYVDDLLLVNGFKFDLRLYVLVTSIDPMIFYLYDEGLGRFATTPYQHVNESNFREKTMHLTNFSINFKSEQFHMDGFPSKWRYTDLMAYLDQNRQFFSPDSPIHRDPLPGAVQRFIQPQIDELITLTMLAVEPRMFMFSQNAELADVYPRRNFGLYGFDVMISRSGRPILVEINKSPSKNTKTALDIYLKYPLMANTLSLLGYCPAFFYTGVSCVPERFANHNEAYLYRFGGRLKSQDCAQFAQFKLSREEQKFSFKNGRDLFKHAEMRDLTRFERRSLWYLVDEDSRRGGFRRLLPSADDSYLKYISPDRYMSYLACWFCKKGEAGVQELQRAGQ